jgi:hypothetical protein
MDPVFVPPDLEGLPSMLAELIRGNIERDPQRASLIAEGTGTVNLHVTDVEVDVGLVFDGATLQIGPAVLEPDLSIACETDVLMRLTNVPLRLGMPDQLTKEGRTVAAWLMNGTINVKGLPRHLRLMIRLQKLFTVA